LTLAISSAVAVNNPSELPCHLAVLDNTRQLRSHLLSTQEVNDRPREFIEEFFYRREVNELGKVAQRSSGQKPDRPQENEESNGAGHASG
jgi:hypothetical protein